MDQSGLKTRLRFSILVGVAIAVYLQLSSLPLTAADSVFVRITEQRVTLKAENADISQVLGELAEQGGIKLWIARDFPALTVDASIDDQPMRLALQRLLRDINHALVFAPDGTAVTGIYLLPPGKASAVAVELESAAANSASEALQQALESDAIPDNIKLSLLHQVGADLNQGAENRRAQGLAALAQLVEQLEANGTARAETIESLRKTLAQRRELQ